TATTGTNTVSLPLTGNGTVTKSGASTLVLSGANTYPGATTVTAGVWGVPNNAALGTTAAGTTVSSGASLQFQNATVGNEAVSIAGPGARGAGASDDPSRSDTH